MQFEGDKPEQVLEQLACSNINSWIATQRKMENNSVCPTALTKTTPQDASSEVVFLDATKGTAKMIACNFKTTCSF